MLQELYGRVRLRLITVKQTCLLNYERNRLHVLSRCRFRFVVAPLQTHEIDGGRVRSTVQHTHVGDGPQPCTSTGQRRLAVHSELLFYYNNIL